MPEGSVYLAYIYVDPMEGGDAVKGSRVSDPPTAAELESVLKSPAVKYKFTGIIAADARAVTPSEREAMKLPDRPSWLDLFEPPGSPNVPRVAPTVSGRPPSAPATTTGGKERVYLQSACGRGSGGVWTIDPGDAFEIGSALVPPGVKGGRLLGAGILPKHFVLRNTAGAIELEPTPGAKVSVNGVEITKATKLKFDDRLDLGESTLILRSPSWDQKGAAAGPDPSCPEMNNMRFLQDACSLTSSWTQVVDGAAAVTIGTDTPERPSMPKGFGSVAPVRVKVKNEKGTIVFEALDPKKLPVVRGMPMAKGGLSLGDAITTGDRVFYLTDEKHTGAAKETPLPSCPEFEEKKKKKK
jgi:hypothetical protein